MVDLITASQIIHTPAPAVCPLMTPYHRRRVFRLATSGKPGALGRWQKAARRGCIDLEVHALLFRELGGYFPATSGRGRYRLIFRCDRDGLKIWAVRRQPLPFRAKPVFTYDEMLAMAREVYGIRDPSNPQGRLL